MKRIAIVGATSGLGFAIAREFIERGWIVGVAGRRTDRLEALVALAPERVHTAQIDITEESAAAALLALVEQMGGVDIYLHSSGVGHKNLDLDTEVELQTLRTNGEGFVRMTSAMFNYFKTHKQAGRIAAISSIAGTKGMGSAPAYSATKRMQNCYLDSLSQLARMEHLPIKITDIRPGFVATPLLGDECTYPMLMKTEYAARCIVRAILRSKRRVVVDWKYAILVLFWRLIPQCLWERLSVGSRD